MARSKRTNEDEESFDLDWEDDFEDDEELDNDENDNNEEFDYNSLTSAEKRRYDKMKETIETSVVEALSKGDQDSPIYKGMQKVVSRKDQELAQYRQALAGVIQEVQNQREQGGELEFLKDIVRDMLDDESKKQFEDRFERFNEKRKGTKTEQLLGQLLQQQQQKEQTYPAYGQTEDDPQIVQYRKEATKKLQSFAKKMGVDPEKDGLDFGDESEALLTRMDKLAASIERVSAERDERDVASVRRRGSQPITRTRNDSAIANSGSVYGEALLEKGSRAMLEKMRKR